MDYIGIFFLVILGVYFIKGWKKGFIINLFESIKTIVLFVLAIVLCKSVGLMLLNASFGMAVIEKFESVLLGIDSKGFSTIVTLENKEFILEYMWDQVPLANVLGASGKELAISFMDNEVGFSIGYYVAKVLANYVMIGAGFLLVLIIGSLICSIILKIASKVNKRKSTLSKILGGGVGIVRGLITVSIVCYAISILYSMMPNNAIGQFINESLNSDVGISKTFYENNFVTYIINIVLKSL